jgi:hypothetical protein
VYDVFWIQSKTNNQFASVSTDGQMMWWDTRKLTEPTEVLQLNDGACCAALRGRGVDGAILPADADGAASGVGMKLLLTPESSTRGC